MCRPLVCLLLTPALLVAEEAFRDDFDEVSAWEPRPDWLTPHTDDPVAETADGVAHFAVAEPGVGMKWRRALDGVDLDFTPWLVIRYRAEHYATGVDYLLWLGDSGRGRDGLRLIRSDDIRADGQWHVQAFDLLDRGAVSPLSALALQCFSTAEGDGGLWVDYIAITDSPPPDAEGLQPAGEPGRSWPVDLADAEAWTVQPGWLGNPSDGATCVRTQDCLRFAVPEAGRGAKWSHQLPQPVTEARFVALRYRAVGVQPGGDYALYLASTAGGQAPDEQFPILRSELIADGSWQVAVAQVSVASINTLAVQVQAAAPRATFEVGGITFLERKPAIALTDLLGWGQGAAWGQGYRALALPPGNLDGAGLARRLGCTGAAPSGEVTVAGVPFQARPGTDLAVITPIREQATIDLPVAGPTAELYLLLAAQLPATEEVSYSQGTPGTITQVERFVARLEYADGTTEEQFPFAVAARRHAVSKGVGCYALAVDPGKPLQRLVLRDGMRRGAFGLLAVTASAEPGPATAATALKPAAALPAPRPAAPRPTGLTVREGIVTATATTAGLTLDTRDGLRVTQFQNASAEGAAMRFEPGPLFSLAAPDLRLTSLDFATTRVQHDPDGVVRIELACDKVQPAVKVTVTVSIVDRDEIGLAAEYELGNLDPAATTFTFPELNGLRFGEDDGDTWYWMPRRGAVVSSIPLDLRQTYSGSMPLQIIGAFGPRAGTGAYLMTEDLEAVPRFYRVAKRDGAVRLAVEYSPCQTGHTPVTIIGCNPGDWHQQLQRYQRWVATWYHPFAPRKPWFRRVFNFRQQFLTFDVPTHSGMFDRDTKALHLEDVVRTDAEAFGGVDYLHLFDWGWDPVHGRCGDYRPWDYLGPADRFKAAVEQVKAAGVPVGLYLEGYLIDPPSDVGKAHGAEWQLLDRGGQPYTNFAPSFHICSWAKAWQDYLSATYARAARETGAVGFYIDEYGFSEGYVCTNPGHGHPVPATPVLGEREMTRRVHEAVGPDAAVYTEESPTDVNSQFQDGSFTYAISSVSDDWSPTHLNLYRFAFPTFKTIEIIICDKPLGSNVEAVKRILFNGEAIWLEGMPHQWFEPETLEQIAENHRIMTANAECFAGDYPTPLVPTLVEGVYANRFASQADGGGKTCWTIYHTGYRGFEAEVIAVEHRPGATYRDERTGQPIEARIEGGKAFLKLAIGPRDVAVVSAM